MKIYLDANCIIYSIEGVPEKQMKALAEMAKAAPSGLLITSHLARLECRVQPLRKNDTALLQIYDQFFTRQSLLVADVTSAIIDRATDFRARYNLRTPDAIHLATADIMQADAFLTGDTDLARCKEVNVLIL